MAGTRAQSCDRYGSGTLHPGQVLGSTLPLLSPAVTLVPYFFRTKTVISVFTKTVGNIGTAIIATQICNASDQLVLHMGKIHIIVLYQNCHTYWLLNSQVLAVDTAVGKGNTTLLRTSNTIIQIKCKIA